MSILASQVALAVKNLSPNAGDVRDVGLIPEAGRSPGGGSGHSTILAWRIPWTDQPGGPWSIGSQRIGHDGNYLAHTCQFCISILEEKKEKKVYT